MALAKSPIDFIVSSTRRPARNSRESTVAKFPAEIQRILKIPMSLCMHAGSSAACESKNYSLKLSEHFKSKFYTPTVCSLAAWRSGYWSSSHERS